MTATARGRTDRSLLSLTISPRIDRDNPPAAPAPRAAGHRVGSRRAGLRRAGSRRAMVTLATVLVLTGGCSDLSQAEQPALIPAPQVLVHRSEAPFRLTDQTSLRVPAGQDDLRGVAERFAARLRRASGLPLPLVVDADSADGAASGADGTAAEAGHILIALETSVPARDATSGNDTTNDTTNDATDESYRLEVGPEQVRLTARSAAGAQHGLATLMQLLPPEAFATTRADPPSGWLIPAVRIDDAPRFGWRGLLLDCGRHFMTVDYVKRMIDLLALHKLNRLHWHLTEDQGWRIAIDQYPRLTEVGAWRHRDDGTVYGGYYTQEQIREVVAYARSRHVTIVPEIELPGHCKAALAAYPELSCRGEEIAVETRWGVFADVYCAGNDEVFRFLENVLLEVMELFPGEYIHIGGDEVPKDRWRACPRCRERMVANGLPDEDALQSWFVQRIERFLAAHGRRLIGWDEILEGGLAPGATVQSWRGMEGAVAAARAGHDAVVSPTTHAYFDYPVRVTDLAKVYSFDPVPPELSAAEAAHILGGEMNMWTEHAPQEMVDSKVFPRLLAMAEVLWTYPEPRDYAAFYTRVRRHYPRLEQLGVHYGPETHPIELNAVPRSEVPTAGTLAAAKAFEISCETAPQLPGEGVTVRYTTEGGPPGAEAPLWPEPLRIDGETTITAQLFLDDRPYGEPATITVVEHRALGHAPTLVTPPVDRYRGHGPAGLCDGVRGSDDFHDGHWLGFEGRDVEAVIDLGSPRAITELRAGFYQHGDHWIFLPEAVDYAISLDGKSYTPVGSVGHRVPERRQGVVREDFELKTGGRQARYVKIQARNRGACPDWHPGAGRPSWIFCDELIIR